MSPVLLPFLGALALLGTHARAQNQPNPCFRWSGQMATAKGPSGGNATSTLWYYGGERMTSSSQDSNLWTNALLAIDLTQNWPTGTPRISEIEADNGNYSFPPAVALGALWASADGSTLYQYGGQFQDNPDVPPPESRVFAYDIGAGSWSVVETKGDAVGRPAEGLVGIAPGVGQGGENVGYFAFGHLDDHTTEGWSNQIARVFLSSLVTFDLGSKELSNITSFSGSGTSSSTSTPESQPVYRADGTFTFVPGLGTGGKGVMVSIGGGTDDKFVDNSVLDIYDIGAAGWTKQSTLGETIGTRVNHCAVRATAKVGGVLTHQIFVYGGQKLNQTDRDSSMYILNIQGNDFTWIFVGDDLDGQPTGRAGHQCALEGNQMIVVGGVTREDVLCDTPGIFVYNVSDSSWSNSFSTGTTYSTPAIIANVTGGIGTGGSSGGAGSATGGDGSSFPDTSGKGSGGANGSNGGTNGGSGTTQPEADEGGGKTSVGAIAGGVVGGLVALALLALLALCLMRKRKRERQLADAHHARDKLGVGAPLRTNSDSSDGHWGGTPYEKQSLGMSSRDRVFASDDVEEETRGMDFAGSSHLVPKQQLRVTNPEN